MDPITEKTMLQLISPPTITTEVDKGKGIVFGYDTDSSSQSLNQEVKGPKLMSAAISWTLYNYSGSRSKYGNVNAITV